MKLREYLDNGTIDRNYFRSKTQFYNAGTDFLIYRVATLEDFGDDVKLLERFFERGPYFFIVPARYDITLRVFIELVPTEFLEINIWTIFCSREILMTSRIQKKLFQERLEFFSFFSHYECEFFF